MQCSENKYALWKIRDQLVFSQIESCLFELIYSCSIFYILMSVLRTYLLQVVSSTYLCYRFSNRKTFFGILVHPYYEQMYVIEFFFPANYAIKLWSTSSATNQTLTKAKMWVGKYDLIVHMMAWVTFSVMEVHMLTITERKAGSQESLCDTFWLQYIL